MVGQWLRLNRLFSEGRRAVIVALDEAQFITGAPAVADVPALVGDLCDADAIVLSAGMLRHCGHAFDFRGSPLAVVRLTWSSAYCTAADYAEAAAGQLVSARDAQAMGAELVLAALNLTESDAAADRDAVALLARLAGDSRQCGLPLLGEVHPAGAINLVAEQLARQVHGGCRMAAELGVSAVVALFTGAAFGDLVKACPVPVLAASQNPALRPADTLALAYQTVKSGARGVMFGPQVTSVPNPAALVKALCRVVKQEVDPEAAAAEFGVR